MKERLALLSRALFCSVTFLLSTYSAMAQMPQPEMYKVKGVLLDSLTNDGEPYATLRLALKMNANKPDKVAVTDNKGKFALEVSKLGHYVLTVSSVGKNTLIRNVIFTNTNKTIDLGKLLITENKQMLGNVTITAQKPLVKVDLDKLEYDVKSDPEAKTNKVLDMLRKVPLVTVDGQDNIEVNGSSNFRIFVNGKPSTMMSNNPSKVLKSMPASSVKNIEVITNPGAKYDAEGVGGILNIVMDENTGMEGYTTTLSSSVSSRDADLGAYITYQKNKLTLSSNINLSKQFGADIVGTQNRENFVDKTNKYLEQSNVTNNYGKGLYATLEASYEFNKKNLLSGSFNMYGGDYTAESNSTTTMLNDIRAKQYGYSNIGVTDMTYKYYEGKVDYQRSFDKQGELLTLSFRTSNGPNRNNNLMSIVGDANHTVSTYPSKMQNSLSKMSAPDYTYQIDYTNPIIKGSSLQVGAKYILRNNNSESEVSNFEGVNPVWKLDAQNTLNYKHIQDIFASYISYSMKLGKLSAKAGLRYEYTSLNVKYADKPASDFSKTLQDWVPSASISFPLSMTKTLRLSYNMGLRRPSIWFLNPYRNTVNPSVVTYGNPDLDSEKNHSFILNFSSFSQAFNLNMGLGHSFVNNSIQQYSFLKNDVMETTYGNVGSQRNTSLTAYVSWLIFPQTRISFNESLNYKVVESTSLMSLGKNSGFENSLFGSVQQTFPKSLVLSLNGGFSTSRIGIQGSRTGFKHYTLSLNKSFMKEERLTIGAYVTNFLSKNVEFGSTTNTSTFSQVSTTYYPMRSIGISVSYRLGSLKAQVKKATRSIVNDDVMQGEGSQGGQSK